MTYALRSLIFVLYLGALLGLIAGAIAAVRAMNRWRTAGANRSRKRWFFLWIVAQTLLAADLYLIITLPAARKFVLEGHFAFEHGSRAHIYLLPPAFFVAATLLGAIAAFVIAGARADR